MNLPKIALLNRHENYKSRQEPNWKTLECIITGLMVTGVFEAIEENKYPTNVKVRFDEPQQWGDDLYTEDWAWGRKTDEFGTSSVGCLHT